MKITVTVSELIDAGVWLNACQLLELNEWGPSEGRGDYDIDLTVEQAAKLGLLLPPHPNPD